MGPRLLRWMVLVAIMCCCLAKKAPRPELSKIHTMKARGSTSSSGATWSYQGLTNGPGDWATLYPDCGTANQSPIDLPSEDQMTVEGQTPLVFHNYNKYPVFDYLEHDGWTAKYSGDYKTKEVPAVSKGGLNGKFDFKQFHFHWGATDDVGSEHTINGVAAPLEIHLVHQNKDGDLAVIGIMTYIDDNSKKSVLAPLRDCLKIMKDKGDKCLMPGNNKLSKLLPPKVTLFYRYLSLFLNTDIFCFGWVNSEGLNVMQYIQKRGLPI
ncbi:carbonic anhydrase 1-like [Oratosquilla oratoria]|uniref:carbonic anhydrase 1-like n=1 Tax=Oratosquilla oratoria TaxID=337810 RepID=UPI003F7602C3